MNHETHRTRMANNDATRSMDRQNDPLPYAEARANFNLDGIRAISGRAILPPVSWDKSCDGGPACKCK